MHSHLGKTLADPKILVVRPDNHQLPVEQLERPDNLLVERAAQPELKQHHRHRKSNPQQRDKETLFVARKLKPRHGNAQRHDFLEKTFANSRHVPTF